MALIKCPECKKEFSEYASACPNCGCPTDIAKKTNDYDRVDINDGKKPMVSLVDMSEGEKAFASAISLLLFVMGIFGLCARSVCGILFLCAAIALLPTDKMLKKWDSLSVKNSRRVRKFTAIALVAVGGLGLSISNQSSSSDVNNSKKVTDNEKEVQSVENNKSAISTLETADTVFEYGYVYISPEDLNVYYPNLEGVNVYTVASVDSVDNEKIQMILEGSYMRGNFYTKVDYSTAVAKEDLVAIYGTVGDYESLGSIGLSVDINDCSVFAVGDDAKALIEDSSDESLAKYLVITEEVADHNKLSEEEYKSICKQLSHKDILRNPDEFDGRYVKVAGRVYQIIEGVFNSITIYIKDSNGNKWECSYSYKEGEKHFLEGDKIVLYGKCDGTSNSTTLLGKQVTLPSVTGKYVE